MRREVGLYFNHGMLRVRGGSCNRDGLLANGAKLTAACQGYLEARTAIAPASGDVGELGDQHQTERPWPGPRGSLGRSPLLPPSAQEADVSPARPVLWQLCHR